MSCRLVKKLCMCDLSQLVNCNCTGSEVADAFWETDERVNKLLKLVTDA